MEKDATAEQGDGSDREKLRHEIFSLLESRFLFGRDERERTCILTVDGSCNSGGAILTGKILAYLEAMLRAASDDGDARICDFFDMAAGTGVGGIFVSMLFAARRGAAKPMYGAEEALRFWSEQSSRTEQRKGKTKRAPQFLACCFPSDAVVGEDEVAAATSWMDLTLKQAFGEEMTLRETLKPILIPCYDLRSSAPFVFSRADAVESESFDFRLWEVCRATAAEPGRYEPVQMQSVDGSTRCVAVGGGLAMSNPTAAAITHVLHNKREFPCVKGVEDLLVLSVGSGGGGERAGEVEFESLRRWREKEWARPIASIASEGSAELVDHAVAMAFGGAGGYARVGLAADAEEGEVLKQRNVESVLFGGRRIGEKTNAEKIESFAKELVAERRRRCRRRGAAPPPAAAEK